MSCSRTQRSEAGEAQALNPWVLSQALKEFDITLFGEVLFPTLADGPET